MPRRRALILVLLAAALVVAAVARLLVGGSRFGGALVGLSQSASILDLRLLATAAALVVGGSLALAGAQLQALLRNPLASPDLLGMSAGAGFAVVITWLVSGGAWVAPAIPATLGALGSLAIVYAVAQRRGLIEPVSLVLVGVIVAVMLGSGTLAAQSLMPREAAFSASRWMLGAINADVRWWEIAAAAGLLGAALGLSVWLGPLVDGAAFSDEEAHAMGVPLAPLRIGLFVVSGLLTSAAVLLAGPVGFVGLVCPHVVRLLLGPSHRSLVVGSVLAGGAMLVLADVLVELITVPIGRLPIGVLTALLGGPVFLLLLRREMSGRA